MPDLLSNWNSLLMGNIHQVFAGGANLRMLQLQVHQSIWRHRRVQCNIFGPEFSGLGNCVLLPTPQPARMGRLEHLR